MTFTSDTPAIPRVLFCPAECYSGCEDHECPYIHEDHWQVVYADGTGSNGYATKAEAEEHLAVSIHASR